MDMHQVADNALNFLLEADPAIFKLEPGSVADEFRKRNAELLQHLDEIQQVYDLWNDKASQLHYRNFFKFALQSKFHLSLALSQDGSMPRDFIDQIIKNLDAVVAKNGLKIPKLSRNNKAIETSYIPFVCTFAIQQYRYPHWVDVTENDVFIDCGAFIGDTALWALQKGAKVYSFEPIPDNLADYKLNLEQNGYSSANGFNLAVGSENKEITIKYTKDNTDCSFVPIRTPSQRRDYFIKSHEENTVDLKVNCVRMDDFFKEHDINATFIKMDIEGAELDALKGAAETIKRNRPKLAISIYHSDADLWEIPLYIKSLVPEYKMFCKENDRSSEFVLYATVEDKH